MPISSPDITTLDFSILYDLSGASPIATLTNASTGAHLDRVTWWYVIATPSGAIVHAGSVTAPDVTAANWTTLSTRVGEWPTPFGTPPCGQVEFSCAVPYTATLFAKDSTNAVFSVAKTAVICRPNGNTDKTCGNFGAANTLVEVKCNDAVIYAKDTTNYTYKGILGTQQTSTWTLRYPADESGNIPANKTANNAPYVYFPVGYSGDGYTLYLQTFSTYDLGGGSSVKIQYKLFGKEGVGTGVSFAVWCNIDLCALSCKMEEFYELVKKSCGTVSNPEMQQKAVEAMLLYNQALTGILQPLCGIDVPGIIQKIEKTCGFTCDCFCGSAGINIGNPVTPAGGGCCPETSNVYIVGTTNPPSQCPGSYFPTQVYDPTGTTIIGTANSADDLISILNSNSAWMAYGRAFNEGNCQVGWYPNNPGTTVPPVPVQGGTVNTGCTGNTQNYTVKVNDLCATGTSLTASSFPLFIYVDYGLGAGPVLAGQAANQSAMIALLNGLGGKPATLTYSAGATVDTVVAYNSSCADYSGVVTISAGMDSTSYLLYTGNSAQMSASPPGPCNGTFGLALRTEQILGRIPAGYTDNKHTWHTIRIGNYIISSESDTGRINFYDITNPLTPTLARTIQLTNISGTSFTGLPASKTFPDAAGPTGSFYSLYFPTDYFGNMGLTNLLVVEGLTGTIWKLNFYDTGSGVIDGFQDNRLLGKCPRVVYGGPATSGKPALFFTQDGTLESAAGLSSGVAPGSIVKLDLGTFNAGGLSTQSILTSNNNHIMAASFDGANTIYFTGEDTSIITYAPTSQSITATYHNVFVPAPCAHLSYVNSTLHNGILYVVSAFSYTVPKIMSVNVISLLTTPVIQNFTGSSALKFFNIIPIGTCLLLANAVAPEIGYLYMFKYDTTFVSAPISGLWPSGTALSFKLFYNLIAIPGIDTYTPNSFAPVTC